MAKTALKGEAQEALVKFEEIVPFHTKMIEKARVLYRAYDGVMEPGSKADSWESKLHPPYIKHIVETTMAALVEDKLRFVVKPKPRFYNDQAEQLLATHGAEAHEILMNTQLEQDRFHEKMRPFVLQNCIVGLSVAKTFWRTDERRKKYLEVVDVGADMGEPGVLFDLKESVRAERLYDGPCTEVVNIEDFFWHEAATELQRSPIIGHRVWMTYEELLAAERNGEYSNVKQLKIAKGSLGDDSASAYDLDNRKRTKDMIEVLELWWMDENGIRTCTIGNRDVELRSPRDNPFWHGEYPFVACSTQPELFKVTGVSQVGKIAHLQEATWDMLNQTHDNVALCNNFIVAVNTSLVTDPDAAEWAPGERWEVDGPVGEAFQQFIPNASVTQIALPHIAMLQNDMQNLAGGHPFTTTSEAARQGSDTATEASLVSNLAQAAAKAMTMQINYAYERIGQQRMELNQQFIRRPVMVEQIGLDQESEFVEIAPLLLRGDYYFSVEPMNESLMRSERRAEANSMLQMAMQAVPLVLPLVQTGAATAPNMDAYIRHWLDQYTENPDEFFSAKPPPAQPVQVPGQPQQPQQQPAANGQIPPIIPPGVTAPQATNAATSPSNQYSLSPQVQMQRQMAREGGISNT